MPVSKNRRKTAKKRGVNRAGSSELRFTKFLIKEEYHDEFRKAVIESARQSLEDFPNILAALNNELYKSNPIGILATVASYGLQSAVSQTDGVSSKTILGDISQHHVELLQALVLAIPIEKLQNVPFTPDVIQRVVEGLPKVTNSFLHQRILAAEGIEDDTEIALLSLQNLVRVHTQAVRNWGYFSEVVRISTELYSALDAGFQAHYGFRASTLIKTMKAVVEEIERRNNEHWNTLANIVRERDAKAMMKAYYNLVPDLTGEPDELINALPPDIDRQSMMGIIMAHFDLKLSVRATFSPDEIAALTAIDMADVTAAMQAISMKLGSLATAKTEHLFLGNPVWDAPGIDLGKSFMFPIGQMFFSHIHRIMDRLAGEAGLKSELEKRRSQYLEQQLQSVITKALPMAKITPSAKWRVGDEQYESDLLVVVDRTVLIAEAKSNRLTASGLRGAPDRVKRHIEDLIIYPSVQSARLEKLIEDAAAGDVDANNTVLQLGIDPKIVDNVIRISVTLDDFSVLSSAESLLKEIGLLPEDHKLAPTILIADLFCITDILENPIQLLHYLSERIHLQKSFKLAGDELDFLGLYLETGFNIAGLRDDKSTFSPSGMSEPIDRYYMSKDAGITLSKPTAKLHSLFGQTIQKLNARRSHGWITAGLHLLSVADPDEQRKIATKLIRLREMVRKKYMDPEHINSLLVSPPEERKARVAFYLFPEQLRDKLTDNMRDLSTQTLHAEPSMKTITIFGRSTEHWAEPYEAVLVTSRPQAIT